MSTHDIDSVLRYSSFTDEERKMFRGGFSVGEELSDEDCKIFRHGMSAGEHHKKMLSLGGRDDQRQQLITQWETRLQNMHDRIAGIEEPNTRSYWTGLIDAHKDCLNDLQGNEHGQTTRQASEATDTDHGPGRE